LCEIVTFLDVLVPAAFFTWLANIVGRDESVLLLAHVVCSFGAGGFLAPPDHSDLFIEIRVWLVSVSVISVSIRVNVSVSIRLSVTISDRLRIRIITIILSSNVDSDDNDTVIDLSWAVVCCGKNTILVESPAVVSCSDSDGSGTILQCMLHFIDCRGVSDLVVILGHNCFAFLVSAGVVSSLIRIVTL